jgi:predicted  nucleic acid-binding Zn-ribbon protein
MDIREQIDLLLELQELDLVRKESAIVHRDEPPAPIDAVDSRASALRDKIEPTLLTRYSKLIDRGLAVVEVRGGMCMGCMLTIPVGDLNRIKTGKAEAVCPNCGRFVTT